MAKNHEPAETVHRTNFKRVILSENQFVPKPVKEPPVVIIPIWSTGAKESRTTVSLDDEGVVKMAPFEVDGGPRLDGLDEDLARQRQQWKRNEIRENLGFRVHTRKGEKVTLQAMTLFYIPITVGIAW